VRAIDACRAELSAFCDKLSALRVRPFTTGAEMTRLLPLELSKQLPNSTLGLDDRKNSSVAALQTNGH
jgi:hypothetical protein